jgi:hypothetical protein
VAAVLRAAEARYAPDTALSRSFSVSSAIASKAKGEFRNLEGGLFFFQTAAMNRFYKLP